MTNTPNRHTYVITGTTGSTSSTGWVPMNFKNVSVDISITALLTGTNTYSVKYTLDDIYDTAVTPNAFNCASNLISATTTQSGTVGFPVAALQVTGSGTGSVAITILEQGLI